MLTKRRTQGLPRDVEGASFVAEDVSPTSGARRVASRVPAERNRPGAGDHDDSGTSRRGARKGNERIGGHAERPDLEHLPNQRLLVRGSAAETEAGRLERPSVLGLACLRQRRTDAASDRAREPLPGFRPGDVIAGATAPASNDKTGCVADERRRSRLAAIHSKKEMPQASMIPDAQRME
jgi:hypothetical protein